MLERGQNSSRRNSISKPHHTSTTTGGRRIGVVSMRPISLVHRNSVIMAGSMRRHFEDSSRRGGVIEPLSGPDLRVRLIVCVAVSCDCVLLFLVIEPLSGPDLRVRFVCVAVSCDRAPIWPWSESAFCVCCCFLWLCAAVSCDWVVYLLVKHESSSDWQYTACLKITYLNYLQLRVVILMVLILVSTEVPTVGWLWSGLTQIFQMLFNSKKVDSGLGYSIIILVANIIFILIGTFVFVHIEGTVWFYAYL